MTASRKSAPTQGAARHDLRPCRAGPPGPTEAATRRPRPHRPPTAVPRRVPPTRERCRRGDASARGQSGLLRDRSVRPGVATVHTRSGGEDRVAPIPCVRWVLADRDLGQGRFRERDHGRRRHQARFRIGDPASVAGHPGTRCACRRPRTGEGTGSAGQRARPSSRCRSLRRRNVDSSRQRSPRRPTRISSASRRTQLGNPRSRARPTRWCGER